MNRIISRVRVWTIRRKNKFISLARPRRGKLRVDAKAPRRGKSCFKKAAASVALAVILVSLPVHVTALDSGDTDGPATKISSGASGTQNKGSEGFYDHNGNKEHGWSSWINRDHALEVPDDYSFRPFRKVSEDEYGPATETAHFGPANQAGLDAAIKDHEDFVGVDRSANAENYWGFKARGSGAAPEGGFGVTLSYARIHVKGRIEPALIDVKITCTSYTVDGDIWSGYTPYIAIQKDTVSPGFVLLGVKEATFKYEYFIAGTSAPYNFTSNLTYYDVDDHQYAAVSDDDVVGIYLDRATKLNYGYAGGKHMVFADYGEVTGSSHLTAFGVAFKTGNNGMTLTFGNNESSVSADATDGQKKAAFDYAWFNGSSYVMWTPPIPPPFKTVSDSDEPEGDRVVLLDENEVFTYRVYQQLPNGMTGDDYFTSFIMRDQIDACLVVSSVRIYEERQGRLGLRGAWDNVSGVTSGEWFDIDVSAGNVVTATAKPSALGDEEFYGGSGRADTVKYMQIRAAWDPNVSAAARAAHGHKISDSALNPGGGDGWRVNNRGVVIIDDKPTDTGTVTTDAYKPHKEVSDSDENLTSGNTLTNANEPFYYTISQVVPAKTAENKKYASFVFTDEVEGCLSVEDVKVFRDGLATDASGDFDVTCSNSVRASAKAAALQSASFYGHEYTLRITARLRTDVAEATLRAHGHYADSDRYLRYENLGKVSVNGRPAVSTDTVATRAPVPDLEIEKTVTPYENRVGDLFRYTVKVRHTSYSEGDAVNVKIWDRDLPEAVTASGLTLSGLSTDGKSLTATPGGFELFADVLKRGETAVIAFDAVAGRELNGAIITNAAWTASFSDTEGDVTNPKKDDAEVYINSPKLNVEKSAQTDGGEIEKGDEIHYQAVVTNINPGTFMRDCVFYDGITQAGVRLVPGSITVKNSANKLITNSCDITVSGNAFTIEPIRPLNIAYADMAVPPKELGRNESFPPARTDYANLTLENKITVTYSVNITDPDLIEGDIVNTFVSPARPNTNGDVIKDDPDIPSGGDFATHAAIVDRGFEDTPPSEPFGTVTPPAITPPVVTPPAVETLQTPPARILTPTAIINFTPTTVVTVAAIDDPDEDETDDRPGYRGGRSVERGVPRTGDTFNPARIAAIMACAGGLTIVMLIRRRRV
ncbi:MAG: isopeptide-forming domain-containing fimbrial protein [Clostridiales Family XIII bacterium]|jgi:fimbrial isopeptide formation D2 family protein|nr:isopeptide-forming domain-containing fimbrial protein [Clostridiales Family XIII bacterium]